MEKKEQCDQRNYLILFRISFIKECGILIKAFYGRIDFSELEKFPPNNEEHRYFESVVLNYSLEICYEEQKNTLNTSKYCDKKLAVFKHNL